jgi:hypothetical protein
MTITKNRSTIATRNSIKIQITITKNHTRVWRIQKFDHVSEAMRLLTIISIRDPKKIITVIPNK